MKSLKFILAVSVFTFCFSLVDVLPQNFTKITEGAIVNDALESNYGAWADYDNDGDIDLYVTNGLLHSNVNCFYVNTGSDSSYSFTRITTGDMVTTEADSRQASWVDFDNDGDLDLFVPNNEYDQTNYLYMNEGDRGFKKITDLSINIGIGYTGPAAWFDVDNDGFLDVILGDNRGTNYLHLNRGDGTFLWWKHHEISKNHGETYGLSCMDYDNDNDPDILVSNARGPSILYKTMDGSSLEPQAKSMIARHSDFYSAIWVDYDNDGDWDLFTGTEANNTNKLFQNNGPAKDFTFTLINEGSIVTDTSNYSNGSWADIDNDGYLDCFVRNLGAINQGGAKNYLYMNNADGTFEKITEGDIVNDVSESLDGDWIDFDNDGDLDLYICNTWKNNKNLFYRNENDNGNNWLKVKLKGTASNSFGVGAIVKVKATIDSAGVWQMRSIGGNNHLMAHYGLGNAIIVDSLTVLWPSGHSTILTNVDTNQVITITEEMPDGYVQAAFTADTIEGRGTLDVRFTDISKTDSLYPVTSWSWDFNGDGIEDSDEQQPLHTFTNEGTGYFDVSLIVSNEKQTDTIRKNKFIRVHPHSGNLALWGNIKASSKYNQLYAPMYAIDGNPVSAWASHYEDPSEWVKIELDSVYTIGNINIHWDPEVRSKFYAIMVSTDNINWERIYCENTRDGEFDTLLFTGVESKYVKLLPFDATKTPVLSIKEIEIYRSDGKVYPEVTCEFQTGTDDIKHSMQFNVYPNPADNLIYIDIDQKYVDTLDIMITDITSKRIYHKTVNENHHLPLKLDVTHLKSGLYLLNLNNQKLHMVHKLVIK